MSCRSASRRTTSPWMLGSKSSQHVGNSFRPHGPVAEWPRGRVAASLAALCAGCCRARLGLAWPRCGPAPTRPAAAGSRPRFRHLAQRGGLLRQAGRAWRPVVAVPASRRAAACCAAQALAQRVNLLRRQRCGGPRRLPRLDQGPQALRGLGLLVAAAQIVQVRAGVAASAGPDTLVVAPAHRLRQSKAHGQAAHGQHHGQVVNRCRLGAGVNHGPTDAAATPTARPAPAALRSMPGHRPGRRGRRRCGPPSWGRRSGRRQTPR